MRRRNSTLCENLQEGQGLQECGRRGEEPDKGRGGEGPDEEGGEARRSEEGGEARRREVTDHDTVTGLDRVEPMRDGEH
eukprot:765515-Hanusia_phi.AAC.4